MQQHLFVRFFILLLFCGSVSAQTPKKQVAEQQLVWFCYTPTLEFNKAWFHVTEFTMRRYFNPDAPHQLFVRTHLHYRLKNNWDASVGFSYWLQSPHDPRSTSTLVIPELRPHMECAYKQDMPKISINHRFRAEYRLVRKSNATDLLDGYSTSFRFRYRIGMDVLLFKFKNEHTLKFKILNEVMVNAGSTILYNHFDQNRFMTGFGYAFGKRLSVDLQYINWYQQRPSGYQFYDRHILSFTVNHKIFLQKED